MSHEATLRRMAQKAIQTGKLPNRRPDRMWGGPGSDLNCAVCGLPVCPDEMGFDIEFAGEAGGVARSSYNLHVRCFAAWEFERDSTELKDLQARSAHNGLRRGAENGTMPSHERDRFSPGDGK